jgi:hypothetical protein
MMDEGTNRMCKQVTQLIDYHKRAVP